MDQPFDTSMSQDSESWRLSHSLSQMSSSSRRLQPIGTFVESSFSHRYCSHCERYIEPQYRAGGVCGICRKRGQEYVSSIRTQSHPGLDERHPDTGFALSKSSSSRSQHLSRSQRPPTRKIYTQCASCMITVETSDRPVDSVVLCIACRSRSQPTHSRPLPQSVSTNQMFKSPPILQHFNSRGELIVPQRQQQMPSGPSFMRMHKPQYRNPYPTTLRLCKGIGCGKPLLLDHRGAFCTRCTPGSSSPLEPTYPTYRQSGYLLSPSESSCDTLELDKTTNDVIASKNDDTNVTPSILKDDIEDDMDFDLQYPDDPDLGTANVQTAPLVSTQAKEKISQGQHLPPQSSNDHEPPFELMLGSIGFAGLELEEPLDIPQTKKQLQHVCETENCTGLVPPDSSWQRCMDCSVKRWKSRGSRADAAVNDDSRSMNLEEERSSGSKDLKAGHTEKDSETNFRDEIKDVMTVPLVATVPSSETLSGNASRETPESSEDDNANGSSLTESNNRPEEMPGVSIHGWDSDLTDLSSSEDEGESEIDVDSDGPCREVGWRQQSPRVSQGTSSGLKIRVPVLASLQSGDPKLSIRVCAIKRCNIVLPSNYRWKICEACRRHSRDYQRQRAELLREQAAAAACRSHPETRDRSTSHTLISNDNLSKAETPTTQGSPSILDTVAESILSREKEEASIIAELISGHNIPTSQTRLEDAPVSKSQLEPPSQAVAVSTNTPTTPTSGATNTRFCIIRRCDVKLPPLAEYRWKMCEACRARTRLDAKKRKEALYAQTLGSKKVRGDPTSDRASASAVVKDTTPETKTNSPFPLFQHIGALSTALTTRFERFMEAQILYLHVKLQTAESKMIDVNPVAFAFDGEYSTVDSNKADIQGAQSRSEARVVNMRQEACSIVRELSEALGTVFHPMGSFPLESGGIVMRFSCAVVVNVPLPFAQPKPNDISRDSDVVKSVEQNDDLDTFVKRMAGELEVTVHPDNSHKLFVGQRYIVHFRLIG